MDNGNLSVKKAVKQNGYKDLIEKAMPSSEYYLAITFFFFLFASMIYLSFCSFTFYEKLPSSDKSGKYEDYWIGSIVLVILAFIMLIALIALHFRLRNKISVKDTDQDITTLRSSLQVAENARQPVMQSQQPVMQMPPQQPTYSSSYYS